MGITIAYRGRLADLTRIEDFEDRLVDLALELGGMVRIWRSYADLDPSRMVRGVILEEILPQNATRSRARLLVYDAVRLSSADGLYADAEREAVARAAAALGVDTFAVRALEGLVQMERVVEQLRRGLLQPE